MKKITLSLSALVLSIAPVFSQVVLQENFTSPFNPAGAGWATLNNSTAPGAVANWFQGSTQVFSAYNGAATDYFAANFNNVTAGGDISNWLFTPVVTIENGAVLQFATRRPAANFNPDRLQVRFSTAGANVTIPAGPANVGTYTNLMLDINPNYSLTNTSAVSNGTMVDGYPTSWTVFTVQVTGVPVATTGRFAFRYFVENGGPNAARSNYIGLDAVKYIRPCIASVNNFTTCANISTTLTALNGLSTTTYSWSTGDMTSSTVVNPGATTVYTLTLSANGVTCPNPVTTTVTIGAVMGVDIVASSTNVCSGGTATLTAVSSAANYVWNNNAGNTSVITITPTTSGPYNVSVNTGGCNGFSSININILPSPTLGVSVAYAGSTPTLGVCAGGGFTVTPGGAALYSYLIEGSIFSGNPLSLTSGSLMPPGTHTYILVGQAANGCISGIISSFSIHPNPTITIVASPSTDICVNKILTLTASGGATYNWNTAGSTLTSNPYTVNTGNTTGTKVYTVFGKNGGGCSATATRSLTVNACTGVEDVFGDVATIAAFPNPFNNEVKVTGFNGRIEIYNALGQVVYSSTVVENETINTSDFAKGVYMLKSYNGNGEEIKTIKLLKN